ncbi:hypothetical protein [Streptomyces chartreusis]|uniref:hypothetical protein n=1 Tax=Streptomyces chartreusis TaxID=1969 RepID=UPI00381EC86C
MVTEQEIVAAEAAVEAAELKLDQAEEHHQHAGSGTAVTELRVARAEAHAARDGLRLLRSQFAHEQAAGRTRRAAEAGFGEKDREALTARLAGARDAAAEAVAAVEKAAAEALEKVAVYGEEVRQAAAGLKARGLSADDGQVLGATAGGVVHLAGEVWWPADGGALLGAVMQSAVRVRDARHPLAQLRWGQLGGLAEKAARDDLLARGSVR